MPTASARTASASGSQRSDPPPLSSARPYRWIFTGVEAFVALGGLLGAFMLVAGVGTPPMSAISSLGLSSWVLPGLWLFVSVAVPSTAAAVLAGIGSRWAPFAVLVASTCLVVELALQIPFLGFSAFQPVFGAIAVVMAALALLARDAGWWHTP